MKIKYARISDDELREMAAAAKAQHRERRILFWSFVILSAIAGQIFLIELWRHLLR